MANIYISYSSKDVAFARELTASLRAAGQKITIDFDEILAGQPWREVLAKGLKTADAFVVLISQNSASSQYALMEIGTARAYAGETGKPLVIPVLIDDIAIPHYISDIQVIFSPDRDIKLITDNIILSTSLAESVRSAKKVEAADRVRRIDSNLAKYIDPAIKVQQVSEIRNDKIGKICYISGFVSLILGILFSITTLYLKRGVNSWTEVASVLITNFIIIGFLGACSRYAFSLGKAYTSESLKAADRIHAIEFGKFYLRVFGDKTEWSELKEVFQYWNIDRSSTFSSLDASHIDPQIITSVAQIVSAFGPKGKSGEK